jgi:hypothetical protein
MLIFFPFFCEVIYCHVIHQCLSKLRICTMDLILRHNVFSTHSINVIKQDLTELDTGRNVKNSP